MGPAASGFGGPGKAMLCMPTAPRSARAGLSVMGWGGGAGGKGTCDVKTKMPRAILGCQGMGQTEFLLLV